MGWDGSNLIYSIEVGRYRVHQKKAPYLIITKANSRPIFSIKGKTTDRLRYHLRHQMHWALQKTITITNFYSNHIFLGTNPYSNNFNNGLTIVIDIVAIMLIKLNFFTLFFSQQFLHIVDFWKQKLI